MSEAFPTQAICDPCGGELLIPEDGPLVCPYCGGPVLVEEWLPAVIEEGAEDADEPWLEFDRLPEAGS